MAEIIQKEQEQKKQVQQQQQPTQKQKPLMDKWQIREMLEFLSRDEILAELLEHFRDEIIDEERMQIKEDLEIMTNTNLYKYLYYLIKSYAIVTYLDVRKIKIIIKALLKKAKKTDKIFDKNLVEAALLARLLVKENKVLERYLLAHYYYVLFKNLEDAYKLVVKYNSTAANKAFELDLKQMLHRAKEFIIDEVVFDYMNEEKEIEEELKISQQLDEEDLVNYEEEIEKTLKKIEDLNKHMQDTTKNYIIKTILTVISNNNLAQNLNKEFLITLRQKYRSNSKYLYTVYEMLKTLNENKIDLKSFVKNTKEAIQYLEKLSVIYENAYMYLSGGDYFEYRLHKLIEKLKEQQQQQQQ